MGWIDFKAFREQLDVAQVLELYGIKFKRKGSQAQAFCPLPTHQGSKRSPSFSISFDKKIYQCFGCGAKGNILELVAALENLDSSNPRELRKAALLLQEKLGKQAGTERASPPTLKPVAPANVSAKNNLSAIVNAPLDFELKRLDPTPEYLLNRGFTAETMKTFGLGYCSKGLFAGRVVIRLEDTEGRLIGYAGRIIYDDAIDEDNPKYLFPSRRERNGQVFEFAKSLFLYNGHRIKEPLDDLIVVEGFPATWSLWQNGFRNVVALMGSSCSNDQANLIVKLVKPEGRVWIFPDLDEAGIRCAQSTLMQVTPYRFCRWIKPRTGSQPTDCTSAQLSELLPELKSDIQQAK